MKYLGACQVDLGLLLVIVALGTNVECVDESFIHRCSALTPRLEAELLDVGGSIQRTNRHTLNGAIVHAEHLRISIWQVGEDLSVASIPSVGESCRFHNAIELRLESVDIGRNRRVKRASATHTGLPKAFPALALLGFQLVIRWKCNPVKSPVSTVLD